MSSLKVLFTIAFNLNLKGYTLSDSDYNPYEMSLPSSFYFLKQISLGDIEASQTAID